jgi:hypothetical protein
LSKLQHSKGKSRGLFFDWGKRRPEILGGWEKNLQNRGREMKSPGELPLKAGRFPLDEAVARLLENCEARLVVGQSLLKSGNRREAERALSQAQSMARDAAEVSRAEIGVPASLHALAHYEPHPKGYWTSLA